MIQGVGMLLQEKAFDDRDEWHLLADELSLLPGMTDTGRLGFALQLKFRQVQGHYPDSVHDFPSGIVHTIAEQVGCASVSPENYPFQGRQAQRHRHRQHIRRYLGVRLPSKADIARLSARLTEFILPLNPQAVHGSELVTDWCQEQLIERPATEHRSGLYVQLYTSSKQSNKTPYLPDFHSTVRLPSIIYCLPKNRALPV